MYTRIFERLLIHAQFLVVKEACAAAQNWKNAFCVLKRPCASLASTMSALSHGYVDHSDVATLETFREASSPKVGRQLQGTPRMLVFLIALVARVVGSRG